MTSTPKFPRAIFFLIGNEFCERFNYYGLRAILSLYITEGLLFDERTATIIYHLYATATFVCPLIGALVADSWLGKYRTILYLSMVYAAGNVVLAISAIKPLHLPPRAFAILGLGFIAMGTGGIKPCVAAFGGDQFDLPKQQNQMDAYFHLFYFAINAGSFMSMIITPFLRKRVHCFGEDTCYPVAFSIPAVLMFIAVSTTNNIFFYATYSSHSVLVLLLAGRRLYKVVPPEGNMMVKLGSCISTGIWKKIVTRGVKKDHWLDFAIEKHGEELVKDVKSILSIFLLFLPLPIFWALFEQQATAWTFQARQLDGEFGAYVTILPDQMQVVNPTLVLMFLPLFKYVIYPCFAKCNLLTTPLQRMAVGGVLAGAAFACTAVLSLFIEESTPAAPKNDTCAVRFISIFDCETIIQSHLVNQNKRLTMKPLSVVFTNTTKLEKVDITMGGPCMDVISLEIDQAPVGGQYLTCYAYKNSKPVWCRLEMVTKSLKGDPLVRTVVNSGEVPFVIVKYFDYNGNLYRQFFSTDMDYHYFSPGTYGVQFEDSLRYSSKFSMGGIYALGAVSKGSGHYLVKNFELFPPNQIHMAALLPQYVIMSAAEVMFSVTGLEFAYEEAPVSMKSVVQALWLLSIGVGQVVVVLIEYYRIFEKQSYTHFLYAGLMFGDMVVFIIFAWCYKYVNFGKTQEEE